MVTSIIFPITKTFPAQGPARVVSGPGAGATALANTCVCSDICWGSVRWDLIAGQGSLALCYRVLMSGIKIMVYWKVEVSDNIG